MTDQNQFNRASHFDPDRHPGARRGRGGRYDRKGISILYLIVAMTLMLAMCSLAVDYGRVQLAKTQLQGVADAAARYGASGLKNVIDKDSAAASNAAAAAADNRVDGTPVTIDPAKDVELVIWDVATRTYKVTKDPSAANAIRVTAARDTDHGNPIPLTFAAILGRRSCNVSASSVAMLVPGQSLTYDIPATSNPFLAGMPKGSVASLNNPHNSPDHAPNQSPVAMGVAVVPNTTLTFDGITGGATNDKNDKNRYTADGNTNSIVSNSDGSEDGIANMIGAPINCLVGLFLDDTQPNQTSAPASLDFTSPQSRDFNSLSPALKQIFFIGDGRTSDGEVQQFKVPAGATRFYVATWDGYEWNNNVGSFSVTIHRPGTVTIVK